MKKSSSFRHILVLELNSFRSKIFLDENNYSIGRNFTNSIIIYHRIISRHHANLLKVTYKRLEQENTAFWIIDGDLKGNRSTNGIFINGKRSLTHQLKPGDVILFGGNEVKAKYDLIDKDKKVFFSSLTENKRLIDSEEEEKVNKKYIKDDFESFLVELNQNAKEPLTEQLILKFNSVQDLLNLPIIEIDLEGEIKQINSFAEKQFPDLKERKLAHPILENIQQIFRENNSNLLVREIEISGDKFTQYVYSSKENKLIVSYIFDYKKRQQLELAIKGDKKFYQNLVKQISEGIFLVNLITKQILFANPAYCDLMGYSLEEILELNIYDLTAIDPDILQKDLLKITEEKIALVRESIHKGKNNTFVNVQVSISLIVYESKEVLCFSVRDITEIKKVQEMLRYQSFHNPLTTLPNQKLFYEQLKKILPNVKNTDKVVGILFIKLKRLNKINYTLGPKIADQLIKSSVKRIKSCISNTDMFAYWEGDQFTVLLSETDNVENIENISKTILDSFKKSFFVNNYKLNVGINMGISLYPQDGKDGTTLIRKAHSALENIQQKVGNTYQFFTPKMIDQAQENIKLENLLNLAIEEEKLELLYQPIINITTGEIVEFEAIIKWYDPDYGEISAEKFLAVAEDSGLIIYLNYWLIKNACQQNQIWQENNLPPIQIKTKLYSLCLQDQNLLSQLEQILTETKLDPNFLNLAIEAHNISQNWQFYRNKLIDLSNMGVHISFDDFGLGDACLNYLREFSFYKLQITANLIEDLGQKPENLAIISAILTLPLSFNIPIVAKGIDSVEQMQLLANLQCEQMQGKLIGNFLNVEMATDFLSGKQEDLTEIVNHKTMLKISNMHNNT